MPSTLGEIAYEAYRKASGGVSLVSGALIPHFADLKPEIKIAWETAARAVREEVLRKF